jgi:hypothetical protein
MKAIITCENHNTSVDLRINAFPTKAHEAIAKHKLGAAFAFVWGTGEVTVEFKKEPTNTEETLYNFFGKPENDALKRDK